MFGMRDHNLINNCFLRMRVFESFVTVFVIIIIISILLFFGLLNVVQENCYPYTMYKFSSIKVRIF